MLHAGKVVAQMTGGFGGADYGAEWVSKIAFAGQAVHFFKMLTVGGEEHEIRNEEVDAWIDKAMAAGKR